MMLLNYDYILYCILKMKLIFIVVCDFVDCLYSVLLIILELC